jgi:glycosyltransferase 2 family protein
LLPLILALTLLNYVLRFVKWQYYLRLLQVRGLSRSDSLRIFVAGFTMVMTPGKVGELLKAYLVRLRTGVPMTRTAPVIAAERLTDGFAMLILAGAGLTMFRNGWPFIVVGALVSVVGLFVIQHEAWMHRLLGRLARTRLGHGRAEALELLYDSMRSLLKPRPFGIAVGIGVVSWLGECVAFYLVLAGLGIPATWELLLAAIFVFSASAWIGGLSMLPGGLGAAELTVAGLLLLTVNDPLMTSSLAGTATLLIRFATLWFGVLLGVVALSRVAGWQAVDNTEPIADAAPARTISGTTGTPTR